MTCKVATIAAALAFTPVVAFAQEPAQQAGVGMSIQGQVGAGKTHRDLSTDTDVLYGAILGLHFAGPLSLELDYQHAENDVSGLGGVAKFKQNGLLGHVRLDLTSGPVTPFLYSGLGWGHYYGGPFGNVDRLVVPAGGGLEFHIRPIVVGARGEYQWITTNMGGKHVDYWKVVGTIGFRFP